jgi:DMSO/TMAO reductase YedYZ molybdopterin-dependent catalytic subunit
VATTEAVTAALGQRSFVDAAGQVVVDHSPRVVVERTVELLRSADKPVVRGAVVAAVLTAGAVLGRTPRPLLREFAAMGVIATLGAATVRRGRQDTAGTVPELAVAAAGATVAATAALRAPTPARVVIGTLGTAGLAAGLRGHAHRRRQLDAVHTARPLRATHPLPPARDGAEDWPGVAPLLTPVPDFYITDVAMRPPVVDLRTWQLTVVGEVAHPLRLRYEQLLERDLVEFDAAMVCIHNRLGWNRLGNQRWIGIPLADLLTEADPTGEAYTLVTRSVDGWECSLPLRLLDELDAHLVLGMGGQPLTAAHGFPARVFVPGLYGQYTGAKWLTEIRLRARPNRDYWVPRGWPRLPARVQPLSRIDHPASRSTHPAGPVTVTGVAWAPPHGIAGVEVAIDNRPWQPAELAAELAPAAWRRWRAQLELPAGTHDLRVRATSRDGTVQDASPRPPYPGGATGHHSIRITLR